MTDASVETLKSLATAAIDARNGYEEAFDDAGPRGLAGLFTTMIETHALNARDFRWNCRIAAYSPMKVVLS